MKERILAVLLAIVLITGGTMSRYNAATVEAAAVAAPLVAEAVVEIVEIVLGLIGVAAIAVGVEEGLTNLSKEDTFNLLDMTMSDSRYMPDDLKMELSDGTVLTGAQLKAMWQTGTIVLDPDDTETGPVIGSEDDIDWGEIPGVSPWGDTESGDDDESDTGENDDDRPLDRHDDWYDWDELVEAYKQEALEAYNADFLDPAPSGEKPPSFSLIKKLFIGSGVIAGLGALFQDIFVGETEINPVGFLYPDEDYVFTGEPINSRFHYKAKWFVKRIDGKSNYSEWKTIDLETSERICLLVGLPNEYKEIYPDYWFIQSDYLDSKGRLSFYSTNNTMGRYTEWEYKNLCANYPIFSTDESCFNYLTTGDYSMALNAPIHDSADLASKINTTLQPLSNKTVNPNTLPSLYQKTATAAKTVNDTQTQARGQTATDPIANNQTYTQTVTDTLTDEIATVPEIETDPATGTQPGTEIGEDGEMEMNDYRTNLREIFPFCLPFDLIRLLRLMDAEPEAPCFEFPFVVPALDIDMTVDIDLSFLDPVMEFWRIGELVLFIIGLIFVTRKLIKW